MKIFINLSILLIVGFTNIYGQLGKTKSQVLADLESKNKEYTHFVTLDMNVIIYGLGYIYSANGGSDAERMCYFIKKENKEFCNQVITNYPIDSKNYVDMIFVGLTKVKEGVWKDTKNNILYRTMEVEDEGVYSVEERIIE